jgi:hypothetical protein
MKARRRSKPGSRSVAPTRGRGVITDQAGLPVSEEACLQLSDGDELPATAKTGYSRRTRRRSARRHGLSVRPTCGGSRSRSPRHRNHQMLAAAIVAKRSGLVHQRDPFPHLLYCSGRKRTLEHMGVRAAAETIARGGRIGTRQWDRSRTGSSSSLVASRLPASLPPIRGWSRTSRIERHFRAEVHLPRAAAAAEAQRPRRKGVVDPLEDRHRSARSLSYPLA